MFIVTPSKCILNYVYRASALPTVHGTISDRVGREQGDVLVNRNVFVSRVVIALAESCLFGERNKPCIANRVVIIKSCGMLLCRALFAFCRCSFLLLNIVIAVLLACILEPEE